MDWKKTDLANFIKNGYNVEAGNGSITAISDVSTIVSDVNTTKPTEEEEKNLYKR